MNYDRFASIGEQTPQFETLLYLARTFPHLPPAYVTANAFEGVGIGLRLETATEAEAWRVALDVAAGDVTLHRYSDYTTLEFRTVLHGMPTAVYASTALDPDRARRTPAEDAAHRAGLPVDQPEPDDEPESAVQRAAREIQELHDPAVIGYVVGTALRITLRPATWGDWQRWHDRLACDPVRTTHRGGTVTAHGRWGDVEVVVSCHISHLPRATEVRESAEAPTQVLPLAQRPGGDA